MWIAIILVLAGFVFFARRGEAQVEPTPEPTPEPIPSPIPEPLPIPEPTPIPTPIPEPILTLPTYSVTVSFRSERVCEEDRGGVCIKYFGNEFTGMVTVVNTGKIGIFITSVEGWLYLNGEKHGRISGTDKYWTESLAEGASRTYSFGYIMPTTGMLITKKFFVKVRDPNGNLVADKVF